VSFFEKAKNFLGGHGVKVRHLVIEKQAPNAVSMPIGDTVVKGKFEVAAQKACTVLSKESRFCMEVKHPDGRVETVVLGRDVFPRKNASRSAEMQQYPFQLAAGQTVEDSFIILMDTDIVAALKKRNLAARQVRLFVKTTVDVEGSPFDPDASDDIRVVE
jgi:hypothetical protein